MNYQRGHVQMKRMIAGFLIALSFLLFPAVANAAGGGPGDDMIYGTAKNDDLAGGAGNDIIYSRLGADSVRGGPGFDTCYVSAGDAVSGCEVVK